MQSNQPIGNYENVIKKCKTRRSLSVWTTQQLFKCVYRDDVLEFRFGQYFMKVCIEFHRNDIENSIESKDIRDNVPFLSRWIELVVWVVDCFNLNRDALIHRNSSTFITMVFCFRISIFIISNMNKMSFFFFIF